MDLFDKCREFKEHRLAKAAGVYPYFLPISENHGTEVTVHGKRLIMAGSNNYLGLTKHPKVMAAAEIRNASNTPWTRPFRLSRTI